MRVTHGNASAEVMYRLGRYHQGNAHHAAAITAYQKVLAMSPNHVEACNGLAVSYSMQGQYDLALQYLEHALKLSPGATHLHNNLGYIHMAEGRITQAAEAFEQALRFDPENRWARVNVVALYEKVGLNVDIAALSLTSSDVVPTSYPRSNSRDAVGPAGPFAWGVDVSSVSLPANAAVPVGRKHGKQGMQGNTMRLVQVAPNVFEFRPDESDEDGLDHNSRRADRNENPTAAGVDASDSKGLRIEVSNGSGIAGMAREVSNFLRENGLPQARLTDRQPFGQVQTEIHYRPSSYKLAEQISRMMPKQVPPKQIPVKEGYNLRKDIQVRILLGRDIANAVAHLNTTGSTNVSQRESSHSLIVAALPQRKRDGKGG
jgi:tetratricopeptide (TPR) repeat protein